MAKGPAPFTDEEVRESLLRRREVTPAGCWEFTGARHPDGYGKVKRRQVVYPAHRVAYEVFVGPITEGRWVLHRCDNPPCFNPEHLFLGAALENNRDAVAKGRRTPRDSSGAKNGRAKLTEAQVRAIRNDPRGPAAIARDYGVTATNVAAIRLRKTWARVA